MFRMSLRGVREKGRWRERYWKKDIFVAATLVVEIDEEVRGSRLRAAWSHNVKSVCFGRLAVL